MGCCMDGCCMDSIGGIDCDKGMDSIDCNGSNDGIGCNDDNDCDDCRTIFSESYTDCAVRKEQKKIQPI